jgi:hypothetical protein
MGGQRMRVSIFLGVLSVPASKFIAESIYMVLSLLFFGNCAIK